MSKRKNKTKSTRRRRSAPSGPPSLGEMKTRDLLRSIRADLRQKMAGPQPSDKPNESE